MPTLYMCKGLPASGKSKWAQEKHQFYAAMGLGIAIVNKDDIREKLSASGWTWSRENEKDVIAERDRLIDFYLANGNSVISSDTNFGARHENRLRELAKKYDAEFILVDFTHIPVEECIRRDKERVKGHVGEEVITNMAKQNGLYREVEPEPYVPKDGTPLAVICDLDGTLALFRGLRGPFEYNKCAKDKVNKPVFDIISLFAREGTRIVYLSGREDSCRYETEDFLSSNGCPKGPLFMRKAGDHRRDDIVKLELFNEHIRNTYNVRFCLDDRDRVVKLWRELGLTCLQVAEGAF